MAPRLEARLGTSGRVVSINANLWFGVKAGGSLAHTGGVANGLVGGGYDVDLVAPFAVAHLRARASPSIAPSRRRRLRRRAR